MATANQIATRALLRLRVIAPEETPSAADMDAATDALNGMIAAWEAGGLSGDVLPLDARFEQGIVAMLAVRLSSEFGVEPDAATVRDAERGERALDGAFFAVPQQRFETSLTHSGQDVGGQYLFGQSTGDYVQWEASTAYVVRQNVVASGNVYECVTAGTSGSTAPTGTGAEVTDGTVTWVWRRVAGMGA